MTLGIGIGLLTFVSATRQGAESRPGKAGDGQGKTSATPCLDSLARELRSLRKSVDCGVTVAVRGDDHSYYRSGMHLGQGLIATSYVDGVEFATPGTAQASTGTYRVLYLGSDRQFVSYFWLCDSAYHAALPEPKLEPVGKERDLGELLFVVGSRRCKLITNGSGFSANIRGRSRTVHRSEPSQRSQTRFRRPFLIHDTDVPSGSLVLNLEGRVLGMVVQRDESARSRRARSQEATRGAATGGQTDRSSSKSKPSKERSRGAERRESPVFNVVFDGHYLLRRAGKFEKPKAGRKRTVGILPVRRRWHGRKPRDGTFGIRVARVHLGSPADRAGVKVGDHWVTLGGKKLEGTAQLRAALDALHDGQVLEIGYLREGLDGPQTLRIHPN